jgi:hypothetical protein
MLRRYSFIESIEKFIKRKEKLVLQEWFGSQSMKSEDKFLGSLF